MATAFCSYQESTIDNGSSLTPHVKCLGERHGDLNRGICVIALPHIQQPRNATDVTQVFVEEAEFAAGQGEHHAIFGHLFHKLRVVISSRLGAVTSRDKEEVLNRSTLDRCR